MLVSLVHRASLVRELSPSFVGTPVAPDPAPPETIRLVLRHGLSAFDMDLAMCRTNRLGEVDHRTKAFYLAEMADRGSAQALGFPTLASYAEQRFGIDARRTSEYVRVGRALETLPQIDQALREGELGWSKVVLLTHVAAPTCEDAWLDKARRSSWRELRRAVQLGRPGRPPRDPHDTKGLPETTFHVRARLGSLAYAKWEAARARLSEERGESYDDGAMLHALLDLFLSSEEDGTIPGRKRVAASLYRVILRERCDSGVRADEPGTIFVDTPDGPVPLPETAPGLGEALCCDAGDAGAHAQQPDSKTPDRMRREVLLRDGGRCRSCGRRGELNVHHIVWRSHGGPTTPSNLTTACLSCHSLIHAGFLRPTTNDAQTVCFVPTAAGRLAEAKMAARDTLRVDVASAIGEAASPRPLRLRDLPARIDRAWWTRHAVALRPAGCGRVELAPDVVPSEASETADDTSRREPDRHAFAGLRGLDSVVERLEDEACEAEATNEPFPHTLLVGPAGTGKSLLAERIACRLGVRSVRALGSLAGDVASLPGLLAGLCDGDILFLDEAHAVPKPVLEALYVAMTERRLPLVVAQGAETRMIELEIAPFTLIAATTEEADLPRPFLARCAIQERLGLYEPEVIAAIVADVAHERGVEIESDAARLLAKAAHGIPREARRLTRRVLVRAARCGERSPFSPESVGDGLRALGYDEDGLDPDQQRYLGLLERARRPLPLRRIASLLALPVATVLDRIEPWLVAHGRVAVGPAGRLRC